MEQEGNERSLVLFGGGGYSKNDGQTETSRSFLTKIPGNHTMVPMTVKQISMAEQKGDGSTFCHLGIELFTVRIVGRVQQISENDSRLSFVLDDGTGRIQVQRWLDGSTDALLMENVRDGEYVTVHGRLREARSSSSDSAREVSTLTAGRHIMDAYHVRLVTDYNWITMHFLQCIHIFLLREKEVKKKEHVLELIPATTESQDKEDVDMSAYYTVLGALRDPAVRGMEHGISYRYIKKKTDLDDAVLGDILNQLAEQGNIYTTIDDYHYKWSME